MFTEWKTKKVSYQSGQAELLLLEQSLPLWTASLHWARLTHTAPLLIDSFFLRPCLWPIKPNPLLSLRADPAAEDFGSAYRASNLAAFFRYSGKSRTRMHESNQKHSDKFCKTNYWIFEPSPATTTVFHEFWRGFRECSIFKKKDFYPYYQMLRLASSLLARIRPRIYIN